MGKAPNLVEELEVRIWRGGADGRLVAYGVPRRPNQTVLDVVTYVQRHLDATLAYRFACRVGMCGSCAMTVNGRPRWTCRTRAATAAADRRLDIEPLRNLPVIRDLVVDMAPFFDKWTRAIGHFVPTKAEGFARIRPDSADRREADAGIECIGCGVCYAACDVVSWNPEYLGPAALNRAWTLFNDRRDGARTARLRAVSSDAGCHSCHSHQSCAEHCPQALNPTRSIAGLKRAAARAAWNGEL